MPPINSASFVKNLIAPGFHQFLPTEEQLRDAYCWTRYPTVLVDKPTGSILLEDRGDLQRDEENALVGGLGSPGMTQFNFTTDTFTTQEYGLRYVVTRKEKQNAAGIYDPVQRHGRALMLKVIRAVEKAAATKLFAATNWAAANTVTLAGNDQWNSADGGDPKGVVRDAKAAIEAILDFTPNYLGCSGKDVERVLSYHRELTDVVGILNGQRYQPADRPAIAAALGLNDYCTSKLVKVTSLDAAATTTQSNIIGDGFLLMAVASGNPFVTGEPSAVATFVNEQLRLRVIPHPDIEGATILEAKCDLLFKILDSGLGYWVADPLA